MNRKELLQQKADCEDAILTLMRHSEDNDHLFVRGVLEALISNIERRLERV